MLDLSLLKIPTMRATIVGGFIYRSGIGAMPFLLPLLLQLGFDLTAFQSGLITLSNVVGAMGMKTVVPIILRHFGFRRVLIGERARSARRWSRPARPSRRACRSPGSSAC